MTRTARSADTSRSSRASKRDAEETRFPVVGIGASAGGLRALQSLMGELDGETGMAFVVVLHLDPTHESHMAELLQAHTTMPVTQVRGPVTIERDQVYIIPPDRDLSVDGGQLQLSPRKVPPRLRAPIDMFFRTLAETHEIDAIAVVLSGTGHDGARGLKAIREHGGITMVQAPEDADFDGMPRSAIATGLVDLVLPAAELGAKLSHIRRTSSQMRLVSDPDRLPDDDSATLSKILAHIRVKTGHDFAGYKRATVLRRLHRRMRLAGETGLDRYLRLLRSDDAETRSLFNDTLVVVTNFFRDPEAMAELERDVVPQLFAEKGRNDSVRVWVAGCATGEEAYSLAMLLTDFADTLAEPPTIQLFATDVHEHAFAAAREGLYPESIATDVSPERLERYFVREPSGYRVKKQIREKVLFATHNLLKDPPFLRLDLISCRNVLIYLQRDVQERVLESFHFALSDGAHLFLGTSESTDAAAPLFAAVDKKHHIFQAQPRSRLLGRRAVPIGDTEWSIIPRPPIASRPATQSFGSLHQQLVEAYGPPSLVVNAAEEVVHLSERVGQYLELRGGEPNHKLLDMVRGEFRLELRRLLRTAIRTGQPAEALDVPLEIDGVTRRIDVSARPLRKHGSAESDAAEFALIVFDETRQEKAPKRHAARKPTTESAPLSNTEQLEAELETAKRLLSTLAEDHDSTIEALRASNEELQSISEEQRAVAEELETSKEELQSINEELRTLNQEHRTRNEELAQVNADLLNLIDSTAIGTLFLDRQLGIRRFTPAVTELFSIVPADRGRSLGDLAHRLDYHALLDNARSVLETLAPIEREVPSRDGRWFTLRITPYRSIENNVDGVVITFTDTSARREAELEREALLQKVEEISTAKSNFIGVISHEFRTPLNAIMGYADILDLGVSGSVTAEQRVHLERIKASSRHLEQMVDQILMSAQMEGKRAIPQREAADIAALAREVASAVEPLVVAKRLTLEVEAPSVASHIETDPMMVRQILFNLLGNAVRYTDTGRVALRVRVDETTVVLEVEDTGIGIESEHLPFVFERFWQADQSRTRVRGGSGLGLMVSRSLAEGLGGTIQVESTIGRGTLFTVRLPRFSQSTPQTA